MLIASYITTMFRNAGRHKAYATITILGLTTGLTFAFIVGAFVYQELQVNRDLRDADRLYLVEMHNATSQGNLPAFFVPPPLVEQVREEFPGLFEEYYRFYDRNITVARGDQVRRIQSMIGDRSFLDMFGFRVLHGSAERALKVPGTVVITEKTAIEFFGRVEVTGETITVSTENGGRKDLIVQAVVANPQKKNSVSDFMNMDAQIFLLLSQESRIDFNLPRNEGWDGNIIAYLKLTATADAKQASEVINRYFSGNAPENVKNDRSIRLNPLSEYYLLTNQGAVRKLLIAMSGIALFIIFLAIANFVNITVARSMSRSREVGIRKSIGGVTFQVTAQFLLESLLYAAVSGVFAVLLYELLRGQFSLLFEHEFSSVLSMGLKFWTGFAVSVIFVAILAGIYPALILSSTKTIDSLKGKFTSVRGTIRFSRFLVGVQFLVAAFVFTISLLFTKQIAHFTNADLGYDRSMVIIVSSVPRIWTEEGFNKMEAARTAFVSSPKITEASLSWGAPNFNFSPFSGRIARAGDPIEQGVLASLTSADENYGRVYGFELVEGVFLDGGQGRQQNGLVINQTAKESLNVAIGEKVKLEGSDQEFVLTGIVKDFHFESMHSPVKPVIFLHPRDMNSYRFFSFKVEAATPTEALGAVEEAWRSVFPSEAFVYDFADDRLKAMYKTEMQLKTASLVGSVLILVIVLTGVLGLVSLTVSKRAKEIGIRKVLGATVGDILTLISREYAMLMVLAFATGIPLSYYFGNIWLSGFAYRIEPSWWLFLLPSLGLFVITILVAVGQSFRSAVADPVKAIGEQ